MIFSWFQDAVIVTFLLAFADPQIGALVCCWNTILSENKGGSIGNAMAVFAMVIAIMMVEKRIFFIF